MSTEIAEKPKNKGGRPKGTTKASLTQEIMKLAMAELGRSPKNIMERVMLHFREKAFPEGGAVDEASALTAFDLASKLAPYHHPRQSSVQVTGKDGAPIVQQRIAVSFVGPGLDAARRRLPGAAEADEDGDGASFEISSLEFRA